MHQFDRPAPPPWLYLFNCWTLYFSSSAIFRSTPFQHFHTHFMTTYLQNTSISFNCTQSCCLHVNALNDVNIVSPLKAFTCRVQSLLSLLWFLSLFIRYQKWTSWWWWQWITDPFLTGLRGSLSRLQLDYVDIVFANRNDVNSPMEGRLQVFVILVSWSQHTYIMWESWLRIRATTSDKVRTTEMRMLTMFCRDRASHDVCNKPGDGHVLGDVPLECHGNHGECQSLI